MMFFTSGVSFQCVQTSTLLILIKHMIMIHVIRMMIIICELDVCIIYTQYYNVASARRLPEVHHKRLKRNTV